MTTTLQELKEEFLSLLVKLDEEIAREALNHKLYSLEIKHDASQIETAVDSLRQSGEDVYSIGGGVYLTSSISDSDFRLHPDEISEILEK